ncbi:MAG: hypothetical protein HY819_04050 [Acidobacteria bacterium]|nr:hypothetical protein [Acidobacteriota bacterium]
MQQKRILPNKQEKTWAIDRKVLKAKLPSYSWLGNERFLERDLSEMSKYLPHWILTVGKDLDPLKSKCCLDNLAPIQGELRCILCNQPSTEKPNTLVWTGLLPVNLEGRPKALKKLEKAQASGKLKYPFISPGGKKHLLVPVLVVYPSNWPYSPPQAHYLDRQYIDALKLPSGHNSHIVGSRTMCLYHGFHSGQWDDNTTIMYVIANRVAPHMLALLKLADEEKNFEYFETNYDYYDR